VREGTAIELTPRQMEILRLVKRRQPITGEQIAEHLGVSRPTIRSDLSLLVMLGLLDAKPKVGYVPGKTETSDGWAAARLEQLKVKDVQSMPVVVRETSTVHDAVITLFLENVGSLIVVDEEGLLLGVISRKDLLKTTLGNPNAASMPVSLVMTRYPNIVTVTPEDSVLTAARKMMAHQVDALPVVRAADGEAETGRAEVVGRITKTTMVKILLDLASSAPDHV